MSTLSLAAADLHNRRVLQPQAPPFSRLFQYAGPSFAFSSSVHNFARRQVREVSICSDRSDGTSERSQRSVSIPSSEVSSVRTDLSEEDAAWVLLCMSKFFSSSVSENGYVIVSGNESKPVQPVSRI
jgi:hypothetical protein